MRSILLLWAFFIGAAAGGLASGFWSTIGGKPSVVLSDASTEFIQCALTPGSQLSHDPDHGQACMLPDPDVEAILSGMQKRGRP